MRSSRVHPARSSLSPSHLRVPERSASPVTAHHARLPPRPARKVPTSERRRRPSRASTPPPTPISHRVTATSRVPSQPRRSQTLPEERWVARLSSCAFVMRQFRCNFRWQNGAASRLMGFPTFKVTAAATSTLVAESVSAFQAQIDRYACGTCVARLLCVPPGNQ